MMVHAALPKVLTGGNRWNTEANLILHHGLLKRVSILSTGPLAAVI